MKKIYSLFIIVFVFTSCEKMIFEEDLSSTSPQDNFEYLWNECDKKYSYFELKNIDWDQVKSEYSAKIYEGMSDDSLFNVLGGMITELRDDHTNLKSNFNVSRFGVHYLGQDNFDWRIVTDNYIGHDFYRSGPFSHNFIADGEIGYIRLSQFPGTVGETNLDFILERYKDTKGLVLDLRENGGGASIDIFEILSRFVETKTLLFYSRIKSGPRHDDFSTEEAAYVEPYDGIRYTNNIAVLTDRGTYSAGSFTALATLALPNMILIGDTTGGGLGAPNGGQLPNGWSYRFSISQTLSLDKKPDFENGVPPDVSVLFDWNDLTKDEILEGAIEVLL